PRATGSRPRAASAARQAFRAPLRRSDPGSWLDLLDPRTKVSRRQANAYAAVDLGAAGGANHAAGLGIQRDAVTAGQHSLRAPCGKPLLTMSESTRRAGETLCERALEPCGRPARRECVAAPRESRHGGALHASRPLAKSILAARHL